MSNNLFSLPLQLFVFKLVIYIIIFQEVDKSNQAIAVGAIITVYAQSQ
jgi:hypothetical protein